MSDQPRKTPEVLLNAALYVELRAMAARFMRRERRSHTLQATALVHEAYLRIRSLPVPPGGPEETLWAFAVTMRRVLVDHARRRNTIKRGGEGATLLDTGTGSDQSYRRAADVLALETALESLERFNPRHGRVVTLRYFGGFTIEETAGVLGVSPETVKLDWRFAKAWLRCRLEPKAAAAGAGG